MMMMMIGDHQGKLPRVKALSPLKLSAIPINSPLRFSSLFFRFGCRVLYLLIGITVPDFQLRYSWWFGSALPTRPSCCRVPLQLLTNVQIVRCVKGIWDIPSLCSALTDLLSCRYTCCAAVTMKPLDSWMDVITTVTTMRVIANCFQSAPVVDRSCSSSPLSSTSCRCPVFVLRCCLYFLRTDHCYHSYRRPSVSQ